MYVNSQEHVETIRTLTNTLAEIERLREELGAVRTETMGQLRVLLQGESEKKVARSEACTCGWCQGYMFGSDTEEQESRKLGLQTFQQIKDVFGGFEEDAFGEGCHRLSS